MVSHTPTIDPTNWDADVSDMFEPRLIMIIIGAFTFLALIYFGVGKILAGRKMFKAKATFLLGGAGLCIQDAVFDWLLIIQWLNTGNTNWGCWMLAAVIVGGYVSAEILRRRDDEEEDILKRVKCPWIAFYFAVDLLGFSVIRTLKSEAFLKTELDRRTSEHPKPNKKRSRRQATWVIKNNLSDLMLCIHIGGIVESLTSFCVVSYCIISGTVTDHEDVTQPTTLAYLSWITSYMGILFKMVVFKKYEASLKNPWENIEYNNIAGLLHMGLMGLSI